MNRENPSIFHRVFPPDRIPCYFLVNFSYIFANFCWTFIFFSYIMILADEISYSKALIYFTLAGCRKLHPAIFLGKRWREVLRVGSWVWECSEFREMALIGEYINRAGSILEIAFCSVFILNIKPNTLQMNGHPSTNPIHTPKNLSSITNQRFTTNSQLSTLNSHSPLPQSQPLRPFSQAGRRRLRIRSIPLRCRC